MLELPTLVPFPRTTTACSSEHALRMARHKQAAQISALSNSPVDSRQQRLLRIVYDTLTIYPPKSWQNIMAIRLARTPEQIRNWFSNTRQKNRGDALKNHIEVGQERIRLRPSALALSEAWSDEVFEQIFLACSYLVTRTRSQR
ncbi:Homeobox domain-containing protein [Mycena chlorophos]|uniref:Homeobox domain-containing protein n=1 Tax=Mycena chlorophos TaxID=658473 RepID=A0A8H6W9J4_MYCCL|nr:Homeobox domain-containing protein [Mycena chlorophos]